MDRELSKRTRGFILRTAAIFCAVVLLMTSFSYIIDPAGLFHPDSKMETARSTIEIIKAGHNVANMGNFDERMVKRYALYSLGVHDTIVLGSSRAALISKDMAGDESFFNYSVTGAMAQDIIAMYGLLHKEGKLPQRVIISLDMWWLNDNYENDRYFTAMQDGYAYYASERLGYTDIAAENSAVGQMYSDVNYRVDDIVMPWQASAKELQEVFSVPYFQASLKSLSEENTKPAATDDYLGETGILRTDGSYGYPRGFREASEDTIKQLASEWIPENVLGCEDYTTSGTVVQQIFYDFIKSLVEDGVDVDFVLMPINPVVYDHMIKHYRYDRALRSEDWFLDVAAEFSLDIAGSFNPYNLGAVISDFYDAPHYKMEKVAELVQEVSMKTNAETA